MYDTREVIERDCFPELLTALIATEDQQDKE